MTKQMPVQAIRQALAKATPGPWHRVEDVHIDATVMVDGDPQWVGETERVDDAELIVLLRNNAEALLQTATAQCPTLCDDDCEELCHEPHQVRFKWQHSPRECVATQCAAYASQAERERDVAVQALWDVYAALGFDTDGDDTPGAHVAGMGVAGFAHMIVSAAAEHRRDSEAGYDQDLEDAERQGAIKAVRSSARKGRASGELTARDCHWLEIRADAIQNGAGL